MRNNGLEIHHLGPDFEPREADTQGGYTVVFDTIILTQPGLTVPYIALRYAVSVCHPYDAFNRKEGVRCATSRFARVQLGNPTETDALLSGMFLLGRGHNFHTEPHFAGGVPFIQKGDKIFVVADEKFTNESGNTNGSFDVYAALRSYLAS